MAALAGRPALAVRSGRKTTGAAAPIGARSLRRPPFAGVRLLAVCPGYHAPLHAPGWFVVEHGRVVPTHPQAPRAANAAPPKQRRNHHSVRANGRRVEPATHALRVGRPAGRPSPARALAPSRARGLGRLHPPSGALAHPAGQPMAIILSNDPLV